MTSAKKGALASRANARKSTGPRTAKGKSRASRNAIRHGLTSVTFAPKGSSERVTQIANKLCEKDRFPYRLEVALEIAEAQVFLDRIKLARASLMEKLQAIAKPEPVSSAPEAADRSSEQGDKKEDSKHVGVAMTQYEFDALKRAVAKGSVRQVKQLVTASAKRFKAVVEAALRGQRIPRELLANGPPFWAARPKPIRKPATDNVTKLLEDLASLERYERSALARKRRAIRRFDALRDD